MWPEKTMGSACPVFQRAASYRSKMTTPIPGVGGIVLAGGKNSRMGGRDKAFLSVDGDSVISRTLRVFHRCFDEVVIVTNRPEKFQGLGVSVVTDELQDLGPLGGLHAGLGRIGSRFSFVTACDMPFLREEPIRFLADLVQSAEAPDAVVPCWDGDIEPLHAVYGTDLRARIVTAVDRGARSMRDFLPLVRTDYVPQEVMEAVTGAEESFRNINTPDDAALFDVQLEG